MATATERPGGYESWRTGVDRADGKWDEHDRLIQEVVGDYNFHLAGTGGYVPLDWKIIKAMLWVESGPHRADWKRRPMQIGIPNDPGLSALLGGREGGDLIIPKMYSLTDGAAMTIPRENIRAGVGYLLMRMAEYDLKTVIDRDSGIYEVTVSPGDTLERLAKAKGSTVDVMRKLNPGVQVLRSGQVLKFQKASLRKVITRFRHMEPSTIAARYNGSGDVQYAKKLSYAMEAVRKRSSVQ